MRTLSWINLGIAVLGFAVAFGYADATPPPIPLLPITAVGFVFSLIVLLGSYGVVSALKEERERSERRRKDAERYHDKVLVSSTELARIQTVVGATREGMVDEVQAMVEDLEAFNAIEETVGATDGKPLEDHVAEMMRDQKDLQTVRTVLGLSKTDDIIQAVVQLKASVLQPEPATVEPGV